MEAQILDRQQADRIRQFESEQIPQRRARWPVIMALAFGGIMLAAGVLLFVSAHWDELSPFQRMALLVLAVGGFHLAGAFSLDRFRALGITLHAVGTVALGGAIAMAGQIFNMQEHWPIRDPAVGLGRTCRIPAARRLAASGDVGDPRALVAGRRMGGSRPADIGRLAGDGLRHPARRHLLPQRPHAGRRRRRRSRARRPDLARWAGACCPPPSRWR